MPPLSECRSILVIKPSSFGDIIHTLPAVEALHRAAPEAEISWVVNSEWMPLLDGIPHISKLIPFPRKELRGPMRFFRARRWMKENIAGLSPDLTVDFQGLLRSGWMARKAGGKHTVGFQNSREGARFFYDQKAEVPNWNHLHAIDRNLELARTCGVPKTLRIDEITVPEGEYRTIKGLPKRKKFVLLHPFSRGEGKSLSPAEVVEFCDQMAPMPVVVVGAGVGWEAGTHAPFHDNTFNQLGQTTLAQLIDLIRRAAWVISVDSGPMHLAAAITNQVLSIHTWTDPVMVGPWRKDAYIYRDSQIWRVDEVEVDQFPERRDAREKFAQKERILSEEELRTVCGFVKRMV